MSHRRSNRVSVDRKNVGFRRTGFHFRWRLRLRSGYVRDPGFEGRTLDYYQVQAVVSRSLTSRVLTSGGLSYNTFVKLKFYIHLFLKTIYWQQTFTLNHFKSTDISYFYNWYLAYWQKNLIWPHETLLLSKPSMGTIGTKGAAIAKPT